MTAAAIISEFRQAEEAPIGAALKYAGGKKWLIPRLAKLYAPYRDRRLVEPFCGALNVALGLRPVRAFLNDANPHVMNFHRWVQRGFRPRMRFDNDERRYYLCRRRFNRLIATDKADGPEAAELLYYLNKTCFNGLVRFNADGGFNVPFGRYASIRYVRDFSPWARAMTGWALMAGDFENVDLDRRDFLYADPPYDVEFTRYSAGGFSWEDQERLAHWMAKHRGSAIASNQATPRILKLYRSLGFQVRIIAAPRRISSDGNRADAREMLATRNV